MGRGGGAGARSVRRQFRRPYGGTRVGFIPFPGVETPGYCQSSLRDVCGKPEAVPSPNPLRRRGGTEVDGEEGAHFFRDADKLQRSFSRAVAQKGALFQDDRSRAETRGPMNLGRMDSRGRLSLQESLPSSESLALESWDGPSHCGGGQYCGDLPGCDWESLSGLRFVGRAAWAVAAADAGGDLVRCVWSWLWAGAGALVWAVFGRGERGHDRD